MEILLAIDGGGSHTRCLVMTRDGDSLGTGESGPSNHLLVDMSIVRASLDDAIDAALAKAQIKRSEVDLVSAGLAGVDHDGSGATEMEEVLGALGFTSSIVNSDMVIAHTGALSGGPGVLALAGTGSVILGVGLKGQRVKIGGWGPVYGDEGSGYCIAQSALRAAARARDGRGPETALLKELTEALGVSDFKETIVRVYSEKMEPRDIAALSKVVYQVAQKGDEVAKGIFRQAGEDLAEGVSAALRLLELLETAVQVSYQGSILESCELVREQLIASLRERYPEVSVIPPRFKPIAGAYLLGCKALGWRLDDRLFDALKNV